MRSVPLLALALTVGLTHAGAADAQSPRKVLVWPGKVGGMPVPGVNPGASPATPPMYQPVSNPAIVTAPLPAPFNPRAMSGATFQEPQGSPFPSDPEPVLRGPMPQPYAAPAVPPFMGPPRPAPVAAAPTAPITYGQLPPAPRTIYDAPPPPAQRLAFPPAPQPQPAPMAAPVAALPAPRAAPVIAAPQPQLQPPTTVASAPPAAAPSGALSGRRRIWDPVAGRVVLPGDPAPGPTPAPIAQTGAPVALAAASSAPRAAAAAPVAATPQGSRRYSVHRQFGLQPDPTPTSIPDSFFAEAPPLVTEDGDPADPPPPESRRSREERRGNR